MNVTLEILIVDPSDDSNRPHTREWIADHALEDIRAEAAAHGCTVRVIGEVSWQRQLARMENNYGD